MILKRLLQTLILNTKLGAKKRADYLRHIFGMIGKDVEYMPRLIPLYPELIKIHDNVVIASNVSFTTHDAIHVILNKISGGGRFPESIGCIEIMDNVFIGANTNILYGVKISENVIIGANSLVNKDLEPNSVYAGIPAKKIGRFEDFVAKRLLDKNRPICANNQKLTQAEIEKAWCYFEEIHNN